MIAQRRSLEDTIGDLAIGLLPQLEGGAVRPVSIDLSLPVETRVEADAAVGLRVIADMPRTHTRTDFDLPVGRLTVTLDVAAPEAEA